MKSRIDPEPPLPCCTIDTWRQIEQLNVIEVEKGRLGYFQSSPKYLLTRGEGESLKIFIGPNSVTISSSEIPLLKDRHFENRLSPLA